MITHRVLPLMLVLVSAISFPLLGSIKIINNLDKDVTLSKITSSGSFGTNEIIASKSQKDIAIPAFVTLDGDTAFKNEQTPKGARCKETGSNAYSCELDVKQIGFSIAIPGHNQMPNYFSKMETFVDNKTYTLDPCEGNTFCFKIS